MKIDNPQTTPVEEIEALRSALSTSAKCISDLGSGKGGWAWEEVLFKIDCAYDSLKILEGKLSCQRL